MPQGGKTTVIYLGKERVEQIFAAAAKHIKNGRKRSVVDDSLAEVDVVLNSRTKKREVTRRHLVDTGRD